jgi:putative hydrolase of the HAD superfamily
MQRPDGILFDLWGTLLSWGEFDSRRGNEAFLRLCDNRRGVTLDEVQGFSERIVSSVEIREETAHLEFTQASLLTMIADRFGLRFHKTMEEMEWDYWQAALRLSLMEGVRELLPVLQREGLRMGVVSNSSFAASTLEKEIEKQGVRRYFSFVVSSADYGVRKPDPFIFEAAVGRLGTAAERTWFAGDNVNYDIRGASGAGLFPVAFNPTGPIPEEVGAHVVISRWSELPSLIASAPAAPR